MIGILSYFSRMIETNSGISSKNFFLVSVTIVGIILLLVPAVVLLTEVFKHGTITTDLNGMAAYIGSVAGVFATAGITKAWSEKYKNTTNTTNTTNQSKDDQH